ncbi:Eco57I restriction-modification methylase domain-containing protein [Methanococcus sp. CF]
MKLKSESTEQKLRGGYYTPKALSDFMIRIYKDRPLNKILEPSCGDGVFLESILEILDLSNIKVDAVELDPLEAEKSRLKVSNNPEITVFNEDFILCYDTIKKKKYDLVVGNPPYIRYQYLSKEQRELQAKILESNGMKPNKLINAWVCFVVECVQLLNDTGCISMVLPAEILQVAYAKDLRQYLSNSLSKITIVTFEELVFEGIEQEIVVFMGEKNPDIPPEKCEVCVTELKNLDSLGDFDIESLEYQPINHNTGKWTKYFLSNHENLLIEDIQKNERFKPLKEYGIINVGITTGNNDYFSINAETVEEYDLKNVSLPLIGRSSQVHGVYFTKEDWDKNIKKGAKAFLISFPEIPFEKYPEKHQSYITKGEEEEANKGYKCRIRNQWYVVPSIWVPDAFFLRRNYGVPKFVLNNIDAVSTDTMHRIKFNEEVNREKMLLSYYNSITFAFTEIKGRSYGGGVLEILPGEVGEVILPNLQDMAMSDVRSLIDKIDCHIRNNKNIESLLDELDEKILVNHLGIEKDVVLSFRTVWKKLMKRRHGRSLAK